MGKTTSGSATLGRFYIYYAGYHMVICHASELTRLLKMQIDDLDVFDGDVTAPYSVPVFLPELFGGVTSEGGIAGTFSILDGSWTQPVNDYLAAQLGNPGPAYRGVVSFISRHCALQYNNPYLKDPTLKLACSHANWRTDIREIYFVEVYYTTELVWVGNEVCDWSRWSTKQCSLPDYANAPATWASQAEIDIGTLQGTNPETVLIPVYAYPGGPVSSYVTKLLPPDSPVGTEYETNWIEACDYIEETLPVPHFEYFCQWFYATSWEDLGFNGTNEYVEVQVRHERAQMAGMNPAHIVYSVLTSPFFGKGLPVSELDLTSFAAAAETLHAEGFGLSLSWSKQSSIEDFLQLVMDHIGGILVRPITTNKYTLKLLRPGEAPSFSLLAEHIVRIEDYEEAGWAGTVNEYTVKYCDVLDGKTKSVTIQDLASFERQGGISVTESKEYLGLPTIALAERVAWRDILFATVPIRKMTVVTDRAPHAVSPGDVIAVTWAPYGLSGMAFRVAEVDYGTPTSNEITLTLITDPYIQDLPETIEPPPTVIRPPKPPQDSYPIQLLEAPYWHVKLYQESNNFPADLLDAYSFLVALGGSPQSNATGIASLFKQDALDPVAGSQAVFCGVLRLKVATSSTATELFLDPGYRKNLERFIAGSLAYLGNSELVEVVSLNLATLVLTVHRGILDTVPKAHATGTYVMSFNTQELARSYATWLDGDLAKAWVLTKASTGTLAVADATELSLTVSGRQGTPMPPGNMSIGGGYLANVFVDEALITWKHRNRLSQTAPTFIHQSDDSLIPEEDTRYRLRIYNELNLLAREVVLDETSGTVITPGSWTVYEHDAGASVTINAHDVVLATTVGFAETGAGMVSNATFSSTHRTEISFKLEVTGQRDNSYPATIGIVPVDFTREATYGSPLLGFGAFLFTSAMADWNYFGLATFPNTQEYTNTEEFVTGEVYEFTLILDWDTGITTLKRGALEIHSMLTPASGLGYNTAYKVILHTTNNEETGEVTISDLLLKSDGVEVFSFALPSEDETWLSYRYPLAQEIADSGRINSKMWFKLSSRRGVFDSYAEWVHSAHRANAEISVTLTNPTFSTGTLTGWTIASGAPIARAVAELGFASCGASLYALGNSAAGISNSWAVYQDIDLADYLDYEARAWGLGTVKIEVQHRAVSQGSVGRVQALFLNNAGVGIGASDVQVFGPTTISMNTAIGYADLVAASRYLRLTLSCSCPVGDVTGYFGCVSATVYGGTLYDDGITDPYSDQVSVLLPMEGADGSTTFTDLSANALVVTANGGAQIDTDISLFDDGCGLFDGVNDYLTIPYHVLMESGTYSFSAECFVYCSAFTSEQTLYARSSGTDGISRESSLSIVNSTTIRFYSGIRGTDELNLDFVVPELPVDTWLHIAITRGDAGYIRVYVNGVQSVTVYSPEDEGIGMINLNGGGVLPMYIGALYTGTPSKMLVGRMNWFRYSNKVIRYRAGFDPIDFKFSTPP